LNSKSASPIPGPIEQLQQQLDEFRSSRPHRTKLPETRWQAAVELARQHGVYSVAHPLRLVDGRKGIDSLVRVCQEKLSEDPITGCVFVFRSRRGTSIRLLSYDGQGYWLAQKRLSKGRFTWWPQSTSAAKQLEAYEAQLLMVAGDVSRVRAAPMWRRVSVLK
jgi:transposase